MNENQKTARILSSITEEQWEAILNLLQTKGEMETYLNFKQEQHQLRDKVDELLLKLGASMKISGYKYLSEAIVMVCENKSLEQDFTQKLYPYMARINNVKQQKITHSIFYCIKIMYDRGDKELLKEITGYPTVDKEKPTNSEFILILARYVKSI